MSHLLVACAKRYNGHELWTLLGVLRKRGHTFEVVSQEKLIKDELTLRPNTLDRTLYDVAPAEARDYDAMVVVSGNMDDTEAYWTDQHMEDCLKAFKDADKVVGAICCSVPTLAPVATGVHVSFYPLVRSKQRLLKYGALLEPVSLTVDQEAKTVTAENQMMTEMWGNEICNMLEGKPPIYTFKESGFMPKGSNRLLDKETQEMIDEARLAKGLPLTPAAPDGRRYKIKTTKD